MGSGAIEISTQTLMRVYAILLYVPVGLIAFRWLIPRLSPTGRRLAAGMLVAQVLVILVSLETRSAPDYERWFWNMDMEWNLPAMLASAQLALVAGISLMTAWLARAKPLSQRLYLISIALVFLFLAWDELTSIHESIRNWELVYAALGAVVAATTLIVAARSERRAWLWHSCLLFGLASAAFGAIVLEQLRSLEICGSVGIVQLSECLVQAEYEEILEFIGIWLVLVSVAGRFSRVAARPSARVRGFLYLIPVIWVVPHLNPSIIEFIEYRHSFRQVSIQYESGVKLQAYRIDGGADAYTLQVYMSFGSWQVGNGLGYSFHLVDQATGASVASADESASRAHHLRLSQNTLRWFYKQSIELEIPAMTSVNRALWFVLTLWREREGEFVRQKVLSSDHRLLDETQVVLGELVLPADSTVSSTAPLAEFDKGFILEAMELPDRARAGETLSIPFAWRSDVDGQEDHIQFLHLGHEETGDWWVYDQQPLGDRLPTRLWYSGLADSEVWQAPLPADLAPGRYEVFTGLYRTRDQERIPASDADGERWLDGRVPLGMIVIG